MSDYKRAATREIAERLERKSLDSQAYGQNDNHVFAMCLDIYINLMRSNQWWGFFFFSAGSVSTNGTNINSNADRFADIIKFLETIQ